MPLKPNHYRAPKWAAGGQLQTILPAEIGRKPKVNYRREIWDTPDGDVIAVDWSTPEPLDKKAPIMVHFHGLEGSSRSHYALTLMDHCAKNAVRGIVVHYRGCGGLANKKLRAYFAADANELDWIFSRIKGLFPQAPVYAMGVSLGANNLLYWAGTRTEQATKFVDSIVAVCSPLDLMRSNQRTHQGFSRIYELNFLWTLKAKALEKIRQFPGVLDEKAIRNVRSLYDFDNAFTSRIHHFKGAIDYWEQCSSKPQLPGIRVRTLVLNALNDPIVGRDFLPKESEVSPQVTLEYPVHGGHCGFPQGAFPGYLGYLPKRTFEFCFDGR